MRRLWLTLALICLAAPLALAQTKITGTSQCSKPDPQHVIDVGDRPNHSFSIAQAKCRWTKPFEIEGIQAKDGVSTFFDEVSGDRSRTRGFYSDTMANGDKAQYRYEGSATLKEGASERRRVTS